MAISQYLRELRKQRDALAENLTTMGVPADKTEKLNTLVPKVLQITSGTAYTPLFDAENTADIALFLNEGYHTYDDFKQQYPQFGENGMNFSQEDFNWDARITVISLKEITVTPQTRYLMTYQSGFSQSGTMLLLPKGTYSSDKPLAVQLFNQIREGRAARVSFQWLASETAITTLSDCSQTGTFYLAFIAHSDNTHPKIHKIGVMTL